MKKILIYLLFFEYIKISFSLVPLWNFEKSAKDLLEKSQRYEYDVTSGTLWGKEYGPYEETYTLKRIIYKKDDIIKQEHQLFINNQFFGYINDFDDIESVYRNKNNTVFICPKGRYHVYYYDFNNKKNDTIKIDNLKTDNYWDLKCFYQSREHFLFIGYLNSDNIFYEYDFENQILFDQKIYVDSNTNTALYAFYWGIGNKFNTEKPMFSIVKYYQTFRLYYIYCYVNYGWGYCQSQNYNTKFSVNLKSQFLSFFENQNTNFYFINFNEYEYESGYCKNIDKDNYIDIDITINYTNPFQFAEKIKINKLKFIYDTKYVYYNISTINKDKFYFGIIDVTLNKIIFNTDKEILEFKPFSSNAMLAITKNSAYKICAIYKNSNECTDECENNNLIIDSSNYNNCGGKCTFIIRPEDVCANNCDNSIYITQNNKECRLCKDIGDNKYKVTNIKKQVCLQNQPKNSEFVNKDLFLVSCKTGFNKLENGNCVEKCSNNYFLDEEECEQCETSCKTCDKNKGNCTSCNDGEYVNRSSPTYSCSKCSDNCNTCIDQDNNCLSCKNTSYKYLYKKKCYEKCPGKTKPNNNSECILIDDKDNNEEEEDNLDNLDNSGNNDSVMLLIFIIITGIFLLLILFCFCKSLCRSTKKDDEQLINEINTELISHKE